LEEEASDPDAVAADLEGALPGRAAFFLTSDVPDTPVARGLAPGFRALDPLAMAAISSGVAALDPFLLDFPVSMPAVWDP